MAQNGKKSTDLNILSDIYDNNESKESDINWPKIKSEKGVKGVAVKIKKYFSDPKKVELWLSGAVLFFGFFGLIFGIFHFKNEVRKPYARSVNTQNAGLLPTGQTESDLLGLKQKDTDNDGLSDYDELYIYHTSAYLEDTDGDGVNDKQEIVQSTDPNCPQGQNCFAWQEPLESSTASSVPQFVSPGPAMNFGSGQSQPDVTQLRDLLKQNGVPAQTVDALSDTELLNLYQQAVSGSSQDSAAATNSQSVTLPTNNIADLTPGQIRELLLSAGVPRESLDKVTDQDLMSLVKEILAEQ